ncbi:MAG TPA: hypothetical protein VGB76_21020 [Pyrinomonadaceae bacterium]|jgi:hypothetical protein
MTSKSLVTVVLLVSVVALTAKSGVAQAALDGGGKPARRTFTINYGFTEEEEAAVTSKARECIWENWRRERPAHCAVRWTNIEAEPTTHNFYIDRGGDGRLQVFLEIEYRCCWHYALEGKEPETKSMGTATYQIVERVDIKSNRVVPEKEDRAPHTYVLRFKTGAPVKDEAATIRSL